MVPVALFHEQVGKLTGPRLFKGISLIESEHREGSDWVLCTARSLEHFRCIDPDDGPTPTYEYEFDGTKYPTWKEIK